MAPLTYADTGRLLDTLSPREFSAVQLYCRLFWHGAQGMELAYVRRGELAQECLVLAVAFVLKARHFGSTPPSDTG